MKKIIITGSNSYVGNSLENWLQNHPDKYSINKLSLRNKTWKKNIFSEYDVVFHVAGIAHIKETKENAEFYYKVNRDLAYEVAEKAKNDGVKHFIFLSTMSVYGIENGVIDKDSKLKPKSNYGKSKLQAEQMIQTLSDKDFKIAIIRPPMIYGKNCKGNYSRLAKIAIKLPIFPNIKNKRSMIFIDNFCEFVRILIDECSIGFFFPQNEDFVCTSEMVRTIGKVNEKKIIMTKLFNPLIRMLKTKILNKLFGDLVYEQKMSKHRTNYYVSDFKTSISLTERKYEI
jgi:nucleoside-diphosphate-sugar epimerase